LAFDFTSTFTWGWTLPVATTDRAMLPRSTVASFEGSMAAFDRRLLRPSTARTTTAAAPPKMRRRRRLGMVRPFPGIPLRSRGDATTLTPGTTPGFRKLDHELRGAADRRRLHSEHAERMTEKVAVAPSAMSVHTQKSIPLVLAI